MASSDMRLLSATTQMSASLTAHLCFMQEVGELLAEHNKEREKIDRKFADDNSVLNARIAINVTAAMNRLRNSLESIQGNFSSDEDDDK